jgi:hypothetical protein
MFLRCLFLRCLRLAIASHAGARGPLCPRVPGRLRPHNAVGRRATRPWCGRRAALALGQGNGERDAEFLADAPGDVPMAGQVFSHQHVAGEEPSRAPVSGLKLRDS